MSGFSMVPRFTNNTDDDDNSVHLKHNIGKANPLRSPIRKSRNSNNKNEVFSYNNHNHSSDVSIDEKIAKIILNSKTSIQENGNDIINDVPNGKFVQEKEEFDDDDDEEEEEEELDEFDTNKSYLKFLNGELKESINANEDANIDGGRGDEDYEDDEYILSDSDTFNEELLESDFDASGYEDGYLSDGDHEFDTDRFKEKNVFNDDDDDDNDDENNNNFTKENHYRYPRTRLNKLNKQESFGSLSRSPSILESDEINLVGSKLSNVQHDNNINWKQYIIISSISFLITILGYLLITGQISTILPNLFPSIGSFDTIKMAKLDGKLHRLDQELKNSHEKQQETLFQLQSQIDQLNNKVINVIENQQSSSKSNQNKSTITKHDDNDDKIITLENNQIQISPEFHQFLYKFIDNYQNSYLDEKLQQLEKFNDLQELQKYVEKLISKSMESIKQDIRLDIDNILDNLTLVSNNNNNNNNGNGNETKNHNVIIDPKTNKLWINSILDLITQGTSSTSINYADYSTGARILGFLTTSSSSSSSSSSHNHHHSILEKMLYGWWIYKSNFYQDEYNANHVLLDDDIVWKGGNQLGIRLSTNIIPTDIILECREDNNSPSPSQGILLSIGFKPNTKNGFNKLSKIPLSQLTSSQLPNQNENKYISKFKLIKQYHIKSFDNNGIYHIRLPIRFINLQISGKDLYFKFDKIGDNINTFSDTNININNIKVYGINEINAIKYQDKFQLLIDKFIDIEENDQNEQIITTNNKRVIEINTNEEEKEKDINGDSGKSSMNFMTSKHSEKYQQQYDMNDDDIYL